MEDKQTGISIRFIRQYDIQADRWPTRVQCDADGTVTSRHYPGPVLRQRLADGTPGPMDGFRVGVDTCQTCGTTGKYDCPACGIWIR